MKIAIKRTDGGLSIMNVTDFPGVTITDGYIAGIVAQWESSSGFTCAEWHRVNDSDVPEDRTFREAWAHDGDSLHVDMERAREVHMDRIRLARNKALETLDIETMRGRDVQSQKQELRDIPQTLDLTTAATPEELAAIWPSQLEA